MVIQRTLAKIEQLKERPHHERHAIAYYGAIGVAGLLMLVWGFFSLNSFGDTAQTLTEAGVLEGNQPQVAAVASVVEEEEKPAAGTLIASSTNGRVELIPESDL